VVSGIAATTRSLRALRWRARAPRIAFWAVLALLLAAGLRAAVATPAQGPGEPRAAPAYDQAAGAFAEGFARVYLRADPARPEQREQLLGAYLAGSLEPDAGLADGRERTVGWTAVVSQQRAGGRLAVTVAAELDGELVHLAVPVERDGRGFLSVPAYPALVGAPAANEDAQLEAEREVEDEQLRTVATRAVTNYLAGARRNLLADLAPDAVVSLPALRLAVRSVDELTWVAPPRRAAVQVQAEDRAGARWTLRYELGLVRRERWYVRSLAVDPTHRGGLR
jgi:Conjugative transposon protein TcpC